MKAECDPKLTILVVEDEQDIRRIMKESLQASGFRVVTAEDEQDAIERIAPAQSAPDLVLIDLPAPPCDLLAAGRRIRREALLSDDVPVVVIAGECQTDFEDGHVEVGDHDFVSYETNFEQLKKFIGDLARRYQ